MVVELSVQGAKVFGQVARALRQSGDKELRKELYAGINRAVKPLTQAVKGDTNRYLPRAYAVELSKSLKVRARRRAGQNPSIYLIGTAKTHRGKQRDLASLNRGRLRHPLYGDRNYWFDQSVKPDWWDDPLRRNVDEVRVEVARVLDDVGNKIIRKAKGA